MQALSSESVKQRRVQAFDIAIKIQTEAISERRSDIGRGKKRLVVGHIVSNISKAKSIKLPKQLKLFAHQHSKSRCNPRSYLSNT